MELAHVFFNFIGDFLRVVNFLSGNYIEEKRKQEREKFEEQRRHIATITGKKLLLGNRMKTIFKILCFSFLFSLSWQAQSQCNYSIYFKELDFFIYDSQLNKSDSVFEKKNTNKNEKVKIKLFDCFGTSEYEVYNLTTDSLVSKGSYSGKNKLFSGKRWVTQNEPPYSAIKIRFKYFQPLRRQL